MSRRRGEFEHRTSIFEGAFRAWSHLGGLDPSDLETRAATELDPLTNPLTSDPRVTGKNATKNPDGTSRREYPYEPLPRSGLAHPYVQAILSPWLGPDADNEAIQLGLTTLRTWWQHRRKGESGSAIAALGTEKMKGVVEGYTRHFFTLAHCIVVNDKVQPPRGLHAKMKELEKQRRTKKKKKDDLNEVNVTAIRADLTDPNLTPLEKLHVAQRRQMEATGAVTGAAPIINLKGKCVPGKIDLPGVLDAVNRNATQFVHRGGGAVPDTATSTNYGDPHTTPVVFVSANGDIQIAMKVNGITCAHCVKIVETVLRGCNGTKSPIDGLLDAAADHDLSSVLIKIDKSSNAKRIAFEAARNLSMVGYTAIPQSMSIVDAKSRADLTALATAFDVVASTAPQDVFNWTLMCTCPDNGVLRTDCPRHSQMNTRIFEAFRNREDAVKTYMAGCGMKIGLDSPPQDGASSVNHQPLSNSVMNDPIEPEYQEAPLHIDQPMQFSTFGAAPPPSAAAPPIQPLPISERPRNPSVLSYGNAFRSSVRHNMSMTSETTFGRAMSGLSALSIDWENLEDFDLEVDHSAHINNAQPRASIRRSSTSDPQQAFKV